MKIFAVVLTSLISAYSYADVMTSVQSLKTLEAEATADVENTCASPDGDLPAGELFPDYKNRLVVCLDFDGQFFCLAHCLRKTESAPIVVDPVTQVLNATYGYNPEKSAAADNALYFCTEADHAEGGLGVPLSETVCRTYNSAGSDLNICTVSCLRPRN